MRKVIAGIGTLAVGVALAASSALAQTETYPMGISSPAFGPGASGASPPAAASTTQPSRSATTTTGQPSSTANSSTANSSFASAPSERSEVYQTYPMGISSPAYGPGAASGAR